jgi:hypothetical protein
MFGYSMYQEALRRLGRRTASIFADDPPPQKN